VSRKPVTFEKLALLRIQARNERARAPQPVSQTAGYFNTIAPPSSARSVKEVDLDEQRATPKRKPSAPNFKKAVTDIGDDVRVRIVEGTDSVASEHELVGLYIVLHEKTFGVPPLELHADYRAAVSSAGKLVRDEFAGDFAAAEKFVAWCWKKVRWREKRRGDNDEAFRPGWRFQFKSRSWLTDYRIYQAKRTFKR
jgi:hypothetical protein